MGNKKGPTLHECGGLCKSTPKTARQSAPQIADEHVAWLVVWRVQNTKFERSSTQQEQQTTNKNNRQKQHTETTHSQQKQHTRGGSLPLLGRAECEHGVRCVRQHAAGFAESPMSSTRFEILGRIRMTRCGGKLSSVFRHLDRWEPFLYPFLWVFHHWSAVGTPKERFCLCFCFCMLFSRPNLGVPGPHVASLRGPWLVSFCASGWLSRGCCPPPRLPCHRSVGPRLASPKGYQPGARPRHPRDHQREARRGTSLIGGDGGRTPPAAESSWPTLCLLFVFVVGCACLLGDVCCSVRNPCEWRSNRLKTEPTPPSSSRALPALRRSCT